MLKKLIPNLLTGLNLLLGCIGITLVFSGYMHLAALLILLSALLDYLDGLAAKLLNAQSSFGKEFDSLADIVSFGVLPASIVFVYLSENFCKECPGSSELLAYFAYLIALFSAIRLAKFNTEDSGKSYFTGLPTPANAIFIASIPLILNYGIINHYLYSFAVSLVSSYEALLVLTIISSAMLVIPLPMLSLKFKSYGWITNRLKYIIILFAVLAFITYGLMAIPVIIIFYIFLSLLNLIFKIN